MSSQGVAMSRQIIVMSSFGIFMSNFVRVMNKIKYEYKVKDLSMAVA